jgi:MoaD family protein
LTCDDDVCDPDRGRSVIRVRLFAVLREIAGAPEVDVRARTAGDVGRELASRYGPRFAEVVGVSAFVVNGERADATTPVADGDEVAILPPVSGGR